MYVLDTNTLTGRLVLMHIIASGQRAVVDLNSFCVSIRNTISGHAGVPIGNNDRCLIEQAEKRAQGRPAFAVGG